MDDKTFTAVSLILVGAGAVGSAVGLNRLYSDRQVDRQRIEATIQSEINPRSDKVRTWSEDIYDYGRTMGTLATHSIYGMALYSVTPPVLLPYMIARDLQGSGYSRSLFRRDARQ